MGLRYVIAGSGATGGSIGAFLAADGQDVTFLARGAQLEALKEKGIPTMIYYPCALHLQKVYAPLGYKRGDLPVCEHLIDCVLSLPMHGYITDEEIDQVCDALLEA